MGFTGGVFLAVLGDECCRLNWLRSSLTVGDASPPSVGVLRTAGTGRGCGCGLLRSGGVAVGAGGKSGFADAVGLLLEVAALLGPRLTATDCGFCHVGGCWPGSLGNMGFCRAVGTGFVGTGGGAGFPERLGSRSKLGCRGCSV